MYPVLFEAGSFVVYSYGFMIAMGIVAGMTYLMIEGKKEVGLTVDQANALFLYIFLAAIIGGKLFLFFEDPAGYVQNPRTLFTGRGFVFYGSFLLTIPTMLWFFRKHSLHPYRMLDVMAITTCLVHIFGRIGCFLAGCCYGKPTGSGWGVTFTDPVCFAEPLNTPLFPTQLLEAGYIFVVMLLLFSMKRKRRFFGQLFLAYLILYAAGRFVLEYFRGDAGRGFIVEDYISHSQFIALGVMVIVVIVYLRAAKRASAV
ncbi:MAG: prolipoprotein diacylglyceryl transferase [Chryseosolibacter sp.]